MKEAGNGYYLKQFIWDKIAPSTALTTAAWVMKQMGADLETTGFPGEMLGEVASKVREGDLNDFHHTRRDMNIGSGSTSQRDKTSSGSTTSGSIIKTGRT